MIEPHVEPKLGMAAAKVRVVFDAVRSDARMQLLVDGKQARLSGTWSSSSSVDTFIRMRPGWRHVQVNVTTRERRCDSNQQCSHTKVNRCRDARHVYLRKGQQVRLNVRFRNNDCMVTCGRRHFYAPGRFYVQPCRERSAKAIGGWGF